MFMMYQDIHEDANNSNLLDMDNSKLSKKSSTSFSSPSSSSSSSITSAFNLFKNQINLSNLPHLKNNIFFNLNSNQSREHLNSRSANSNEIDECNEDLCDEEEGNSDNDAKSANPQYKIDHFLHLGLSKCKYFESPISNAQIQYDCSAPIARNTPENNEVKLVDYRQTKIASFNVDGKELICLPQAFEMFLKNLVGGLHTVYTKLKRLDIVPIVCNVEQVRILRGLGAIQPGVNRCKLIAPFEFDILYEDCTNSGSRPGRPPKRHTQNEADCSNAKLANSDANEKRKNSQLNESHNSSILKNLNLNPNMKENMKSRNLSINIDTLTNQSNMTSESSNYLIGNFQYPPRVDLSHYVTHSNENRASFNNNLLKAMSIEHFANKQHGFHFDSNFAQHPVNLKQHKLQQTNFQSDYNNENIGNLDFANLNHAATAAAALAFYGSVFKSNFNQSSSYNMAQSGSLNKWNDGYHCNVDTSRNRQTSLANSSMLNTANAKQSKEEIAKNTSDSSFSSSMSASSSRSFQKSSLNLDTKSSEIYQLAETHLQKTCDDDSKSKHNELSNESINLLNENQSTNGIKLNQNKPALSHISNLKTKQVNSDFSISKNADVRFEANKTLSSNAFSIDSLINNNKDKCTGNLEASSSELKLKKQPCENNPILMHNVDSASLLNNYDTCNLIDVIKSNLYRIENNFQSDLDVLMRKLKNEKAIRKKRELKINKLLRFQNLLRYRLKVKRCVESKRRFESCKYLSGSIRA